jgi:hypothetical protein
MGRTSGMDGLDTGRGVEAIALQGCPSRYNVIWGRGAPHAPCTRPPGKFAGYVVAVPLFVTLGKPFLERSSDKLVDTRARSYFVLSDTPHRYLIPPTAWTRANACSSTIS